MASSLSKTMTTSSLIALPILIASLLPSGAAERQAVDSLSRVGASEKICQLIGEIDWETGRPTAAKTLSNFGLDGADLGYPVENRGKLLLLFGDSWPPPHGGGAAGGIPPDDAVGVTLRKDPPSRDGGCLDLQIHDTGQQKRLFAPAKMVGPTPVKQGFFNVPSGGVSVGKQLYGFFWTDHCSHPNPLGPLPESPLARPAPTQKCPETDGSNSVGRAVLASSDDEGHTFNHAVSMPVGFVYSIAVNAEQESDLPPNQRLGVFVFGVPRYRASAPYLAYAPPGSLADISTWRFFVGLSADGAPQWATREEWSKGAAPGDTAPDLARWRPPGEPEITAPSSDAGRCIGELSVTRNRPLGAWLMLYNCPGGIEARIAPAPWGPWSPPTNILGGNDDVACRLVMTPAGCGDRRDFWPDGHVNGKFVAGGFYAPYVLNRYSAAGETNGASRSATIYWLVSSWNPYEVTVMRTTLQRKLN